MASLRKLLLTVILALTALLMDGCSAGCNEPGWLLHVATDSIGTDATGLNVAASDQVCIAPSAIGD